MSELDTVIAVLCRELNALEKTASSVEDVILDLQGPDRERQLRDAQLRKQSLRELVHSLKCVLNHLDLKRECHDWQSQDEYDLMCSFGPRLH